MIVDLEGREIQDVDAWVEWQSWQHPKTISLEFTQRELTFVVIALEVARRNLEKATTALRGEELNNGHLEKLALPSTAQIRFKVLML